MRLLPEPPPTGISHRISLPKDEPSIERMHEDNDNVECDRVSLSSHGHVALGSRIRSAIHNLGLQCISGNLITPPTKHLEPSFISQSDISKYRPPILAHNEEKSPLTHLPLWPNSKILPNPVIIWYQAQTRSVQPESCSWKKINKWFVSL